ncbi:hypothetical protein [Chitinibacter sp. S2-10]|uniref:hypothetical protein n=1 Tax=Chitinibacter sp. S2-10 TaxID=3373597 RepID=UPI003977AC6E
MSINCNRGWRFQALITICLMVSWGAAQACSRPIKVGVSPITSSVTIVNGQVTGGIYIDGLREISRRTGCKFEYVVAPFVRSLYMFSTSHDVDLLPIAIERSSLNQAGELIPVVTGRVALVLYGSVPADPLRALEQGQLKVNVVRGSSYDVPEYQHLLKRLREREVLEEVTEPSIILRKFKAGYGNAALMITSTLYLGLQETPLDQNKLKVIQLPAIPEIKAGPYLSLTRLSPADRNLLRKELVKQFQNKTFWQQYEKIYPAWVLQGLHRYQPPSAAP